MANANGCERAANIFTFTSLVAVAMKNFLINMQSGQN